MQPPRHFTFENCWPSLSGYNEIVQEAWSQPVHEIDPINKLIAKMQKTARALKAWSRLQIGDLKLQLHLALEVVLRLDKAQELRILSQAEHDLRIALKLRILGLAAIQRMRWKQRSRLGWLRLGDANTKFFHSKANARRRRKLINTLTHQGGIFTLHAEKEEALAKFYTEVLGTAKPAAQTFCWESLGLKLLPDNAATDLEQPFTEQEIKLAIDELSADKAPGPDGFTGTFFQSKLGDD